MPPFPAVLLISVAWPTLDLDGYLRRRVPALAFLQLFLFALPFNFSTDVFNVLAPHPGTGRLAVVFDVFQLFMSELRGEGGCSCGKGLESHPKRVLASLLRLCPGPTHGCHPATAKRCFERCIICLPLAQAFVSRC